MARKFDSIKDIDGKRETLRLAVRITDLWVVPTRDNSGHLEMVIMDSNGDKILCVARKEQFDMWSEMLKEGSTYIMNNFRAVPNDGQYRICNHALKLLFTSGTTLKAQVLPNIANNVYHFMDFEDILNGKANPDVLIDIIGAVEKINFQGITNGKRKIVFNLKDEAGKVINCTLWEEYALKLMNFSHEQCAEDLIVIVLTHAKIKEANGVFPLGISNSYRCSKLFINADIEEITKFRSSFDVSKLMQIETQSENLSQISTFSQFSASSQYSEQEKFMYKASAKTLSQINESRQEIQCLTVATISKIIVGSNGWYYEGCTNCYKSADPKKLPYTCICGRYIDKPATRYKVEVEVNHKKFNSKFVFWDRECEKLIGMTATDLRLLMIKELGEDNPKEIPESLDRMLGCTLAFRVRVQPKFNNSGVMKMSNDKELIKLILDQLGADEEATSESDQSMNIVNLDSQTQQSLSGTADHDPELGSAVTPAKRQPSQLASDDNVTQDLASAQLSSTKLSKHIKTE